MHSISGAACEFKIFTFSDEMILHFLHACYFNVNNTKATMELFYSYRTSMTEFFNDWDPLSKETEETVKNVL